MSTSLNFSQRLYSLPGTVASAFLGLLLTSACSQEPQLGQLSPMGGFQTSAMMSPVPGQIIVADVAGNAIPNATVLIGLRENVPFPGNLLKSDANGVVSFPKEWTDSQPVTVEASGFVRTTWMSQSATISANGIVFTPRRKIAPQRLEFKGKTTGYANLTKDKWADVGVVFPALRRDQLATLQVTDLISPEIDSMTILGQTIEIPSNISIPKQDERYYFTVTLEKPIFRTYLKEPRSWKMVATHARFPFEAVVDEMRAGKSFFDVLNYIEFKSSSVADISVSKPTTSRDMSVTDTKFDSALDVAAPKFAAKYTMLAVSVAENSGMLYPTDVKMLTSGQARRLVAPKGVAGFLVGALRETKAPTAGVGADALSAVISSNNVTTNFEFLNLPGVPKIKGSTLVLDPPAATVTTMTAVATYATLNKIDKISAGATQLESKSPVWDVYSSGWATMMDLPDLSVKIAGAHRWEVLFGGAPNGTTVRLAPSMIEGLSHISKSAADL